LEEIVIGFGLISLNDLPIVTSWSKPENFKKGSNTIKFTFDGVCLAPATYKLAIGISRGAESIDFNNDLVFFNVSDILNFADAGRLVNSSSAVLLNQFPYKISS
jgi:hypothetical protein